LAQNIEQSAIYKQLKDTMELFQAMDEDLEARNLKEISK
jgi:sulfur transfer complex TusBCD TusB component (DsrH family)